MPHGTRHQQKNENQPAHIFRIDKAKAPHSCFVQLDAHAAWDAAPAEE
ncbi:hypothetical protein B4098_0909 [Heyndrickxia coagulans]|uniref:Uncharacterized protein n=1 Tax=Heyndrickxia coagulans TaxID=1398 RepID=A0A150K2D3_HEYCO|nr:hypothetical protein B4098_0909 [Heyndrickxia coagulans]